MDIARTTGFMEGVVAADSALHMHIAVKVEFAIVLQACAQWKGVVRARQVLDFADGQAESALESVARVRFAQFRIPPPVLQVNIRGTQGFIGRADFCWDEYRTIAEADGALKYEDQGRDEPAPSWLETRSFTTPAGERSTSPGARSTTSPLRPSIACAAPSPATAPARAPANQNAKLYRILLERTSATRVLWYAS